MHRPYGRSLVCFFALCVLRTEEPLQAQEIGTRIGARRGGEISYELQGSGVLFDALDPAVKKWYVPQELFYEFQWRQWQYSNYARSRYLRYVNTSLEGDYFYDLYGNFITRGKLVYDWRVSTPQVAGNALFKGSEFRSWFNNLVIASDSKGQYFYSLTVGDRIRTTLTPMTFSKPSFTGMQFDFASDKYEFTLLASRPSAAGAVGDLGPSGAGERSNDTNLLGGRGTIQVGDFVRLGTTYVSAFNAQTKNQAFSGNPFRGTLTEGQNNDVTRIEIRLSDDSPEDGDGGTAFFQEEIVITNIDGKRFSNRRPLDGNSILNFFPTIQGGFRQEGFLSADGSEVISLIYDLEGPEYRQAFGPAPDRIKSVEFVLLLANDYRIDLTSNRQVNQKRQPVTLSEGIPERTIRAPGNVQDGSNQRFISLLYGLPVGNEIFGFTLDVENAQGFFLAGEFAHNRQHKRYPRRLETDVTEHTPSQESGDAWFLNLYKRSHPLFFFAEAYSMDPNYSTSTFLAGVQNDLGPILYDDNRQFVYEFVEDNDDQDRFPDWFRRGFTRDTEIFPGWDENRDFIVDFNQNDNLRRPNTIPDYEEPFLRYSSDRPDFLFGIDMNNNGIVDRFENDTQPDYLYKRDRQGYNIYVGSSLGPDARLSVGHQRERQLADDRRNKSTYLLLTYEKDFPRRGRLQFYDNLRRIEDNIRDNVIEWVLREGSRGDFVPFEDPLPARNAWANTLYLGYQYAADNLRIINRFKYEFFRQVDFDERPFKQQNIREMASLLGIINKAEYTFNLGALRLEPRWKNEFLRHRPTRKEEQIRVATTELRELLSLIGRISILSRTTLQIGLEYFYVNQFRDILENDPVRSDRNELIYALQLTNNVAYLGYDLWAQAGIHIARVDRKAAAKAQTESSLFLTLYAGFGE